MYALLSTALSAYLTKRDVWPASLTDHLKEEQVSGCASKRKIFCCLEYTCPNWVLNNYISLGSSEAGPCTISLWVHED